MPRDHWRRARDRDVSDAARREYAADGTSSYPRVWSEDPLPRLAPRPPARPRHEAPPVPPTAVVWCVYDDRNRVVKTFDLPDKARAEAEAGRLEGLTGVEHYVAADRVLLTVSKATPVAERAATPAQPLATQTGAVGPTPLSREPWYRRVASFLRRLFSS